LAEKVLLPPHEFSQKMGEAMKFWREKMLSTTVKQDVIYYAIKLNGALADFKKRFDIDYSFKSHLDNFSLN
jgi:hypothetical protein